MMDWLQAISTVGFPIVAFLLMYYHNTKTVAKLTVAINELKEELVRGRN